MYIVCCDSGSSKGLKSTGWGLWFNMLLAGASVGKGGISFGFSSGDSFFGPQQQLPPVSDVPFVCVEAGGFVGLAWPLVPLVPLIPLETAWRGTVGARAAGAGAVPLVC